MTQDSAVSTRIQFKGLARAVRLPGDAPELLETLTRVFNGWAAAPASNIGSNAQEDLCRVVRDSARTFSVHSSFVTQRIEGLPLASAVCAIAADLAQGYSEDRPGSLTLHCGAFQLGDNLIALTGRARAGKSTLIARLAMEPDLRVFCDDVLPIDETGCGVALGIAPRIRVPLPKAVSACFRCFVEERAGPIDDQYGYVISDTVAAHGAKAPLTAVVELNRRPRARARLHRLDAADAVQLIAEQNMADLLTARRAFDQISALVNGLQRFSLVYSDLDDAVDLLRRTFAGGPTSTVDDAVDSSRRRSVLTRPRQTSFDVQRHVWTRGKGVKTRQIDEAAFLFREDDKTLWRMNELATAVWVILDEPSSIGDIVDLLGEAFPQTSRATLQLDLIALFEILAEGNLTELLERPLK